MSITHAQIINNTSNMAIDELIQLNNELVHIIKHRRKMECKDMRVGLSIGDKVFFRHAKSNNKIEGTIKKIMRTMALVEERMGATWKVPMSIIKFQSNNSIITLQQQ